MSRLIRIPKTRVRLTRKIRQIAAKEEGTFIRVDASGALVVRFDHFVWDYLIPEDVLERLPKCPGIALYDGCPGSRRADGSIVPDAPKIVRGPDLFP